tara:strand:- start:1874 stop:2242 length:369 start_codon:yes stop_codon:yes gene_type:complete
MLQSVNALFVNIMVVEAAYRRAKAVTAAPIATPTGRAEEAMKLFSALRIAYLPDRISVQDVFENVIQQKESYEDILYLCRTDPFVLALSAHGMSRDRNWCQTTRARTCLLPQIGISASQSST